MRMSRLLVRTLREAPADAEVASHQLLVRGGFIRRLASGVYTFLPLGLRVLHNIEAVIRQELDADGCQELLLPALHPLELWEQSGRAAMFGSDALPAMQVEARGGSFVLGPTHEEVVTVTVGAEVDSYRQLPLTVYQIQVKFRDEARPRFGLLRTRELIMCDAYSFDVDKAAMQASYRTVYDAYLRIFARMDLAVSPVEAESGAIGGEVNHGVMVPSAVRGGPLRALHGLSVRGHVEAATRGGFGDPVVPDPVAPPVVEHHTPDRPGHRRGRGLLRRFRGRPRRPAQVPGRGRRRRQRRPPAPPRGPRGAAALRLAALRGGRTSPRTLRWSRATSDRWAARSPVSPWWPTSGVAPAGPIDRQGPPGRPPRRAEALVGRDFSVDHVGLLRRGGQRRPTAHAAVP